MGYAETNSKSALKKHLYHICTTRPNIFNVGPTTYKCYTNILC